MLELYSLKEIPVSASIAMDAANLPKMHNDRIIIATAIANKVSVVTADAKFKECPELKIVW
jgi:PIN domain nuclease of toxin-antitoxin system